jgi:hypothetical protein
MNQPSFRDVELLSAYLDGQLPQVDSARLESRLKADPQLRSVYDDLLQARSLLRKLPARRAPRNFVLTPRMAGIKPPLPRIFPVFRLASALAAILLFFSYAINLSAPALTSMRAAAPAPALGLGAGGGSPSEEQPSMEMSAAPTEGPRIMATHAPSTEAVQDNFATTPTNTLRASPTAEETLMIPPQGDAQQKSIPYDTQLQPEPVSLPVPPSWLYGLLAFAVVSGGTAAFVRMKVEQDWRKANALKPQKITTRDMLRFGLVVLVMLLFGAGIYWMSITPFYAP